MTTLRGKWKPPWALRPMILLAYALAIVVLAAGCGGGDDSSSATDQGAGNTAGNASGSAPSKEVFLKRAVAACFRERGNILSDFSAYVKKHEKEDLPEPLLTGNVVRAVLLPKIRSEINAIRAIGFPKGDDAELEAMLEEEEAIVEELEKKVERVTGFEEIEDEFVEVSQKMIDYGFKGCTNGPQF